MMKDPIQIYFVYVICRKFYASANIFLLTLFTRMILFGFIWLKAIVYQFYSIAVQLLN